MACVLPSILLIGLLAIPLQATHPTFFSPKPVLLANLYSNSLSQRLRFFYYNISFSNQLEFYPSKPIRPPIRKSSITANETLLHYV